MILEPVIIGGGPTAIPVLRIAVSPFELSYRIGSPITAGAGHFTARRSLNQPIATFVWHSMIGQAFTEFALPLSWAPAGFAADNIINVVMVRGFDTGCVHQLSFIAINSNRRATSHNLSYRSDNDGLMNQLADRLLAVLGGNQISFENLARCTGLTDGGSAKT